MSEVFDVLIDQPFFEGMTDDQVRAVAETARLVTFEEGAVMFVEGGPARRTSSSTAMWPFPSVHRNTERRSFRLFTAAISSAGRGCIRPIGGASTPTFRARSQQSNSTVHS